MEVENDCSYEVERLLRWCYVGPNGKRTRQKKREFLVLWKDSLIDSTSWAHEDNFDYPEELTKMIERDQPTEDSAT